MRKISHDCKENIAAINITLENDGLHDTIMNVTLESFIDFDNILVLSKLYLPDDKSGKSFTREYFSTSLDVSKITKAMKANALIRVVVEDLLKSLDFELKFPMKKVRFMSYS